MEQHQHRTSILRGTFLLTASSLIVKILSAVYRIPFQNLVGNTGFYIYQQIYPFYGIGMTFALSGFPIFISKKVAEQSTMTEKLLVGRNYWYLLSIFGFFLFLSAEFGADILAKLMGDSKLAALIKSVGWMYLLMPFLASGRGFYQGLLEMKKTAYSQLVEQVIRVAVIIFAAYWAKKTGGSFYQAGSWAMLAATFGAAVALLFFSQLFFKGFFKLSARINFKQLLKLAKPLFSEGMLFCLNAALLILLQLIDSFTLKNALQNSGLTFEQAADLKGIYDRGQPLIQLGLVLTNSLATSFLPEFVKNRSSNDRSALKKQLDQLFEAAFLFSLAAAAGMSILMPQINWLLFGDSAGSAVLAINSLLIPLAALVVLNNVYLQGQNQKQQAAWVLLSAVAVKLLINYPLVYLWGIMGGSIASDLSLLVAVIVGGLFAKEIRFSYLKNGKWYQNLVIICWMMLTAKVISWSLGLFLPHERISNLYILLGAILGGTLVLIKMVVNYQLVDVKKILQAIF
jgi:PST family polysaccharide transporter